MSNPNNLGNGCSLEDCHTNLFALADLAGIKWRKLKCENVLSVDPLDDPVLLSFTRCIQADILCVWQRAKKSGVAEHSAPSGEQLNCAKELWLFWYGDHEPAIMSSLVDSGLSEVNSGSWDNGLTYECRTLLFKALHNLIERCLLSRNFVRIGKWFVQPFDHLPRSTAYDKSTHLSISFSFFLHGESTVCASIDVREHPPLWRLHPYHLNAVIQCSQQALPVVLAPYGLAGSLTGQAYKESDSNTQKVLEEWKQFFVVPDPETWECHAEQSTLPKLVEVVVAGVRMRYPASYVLVHGDTEAEIIQQNGGVLPLTPTLLPSGAGNNQQSSPLGPDQLLKRATTGYPEQEHDATVTGSSKNAVSARALDKVMQDGAVTSGVHNTHHPPSNTSSNALGNPPSNAPSNGEDPNLSPGTWSLGEPLQKNSCACVKGKGVKGRGGGRASPVGPRHKDKDGRGRRHVPFHRRATLSEAYISREVDGLVMRLPPQAVGSYKAPQASTNQSTLDVPPTAPTNDPNPPSAANSGFDSNLLPTTVAVESPHSAAPSPLLVHGVHSADDAPHDATMPTLSPQPLGAVKTEKQEAGGATDSASVSAMSADGSALSLKSGGAPLAHVALKQEGGDAAGEAVLYRTESINTWLEAQQRCTQGATALKRPALAQQSYELHDEAHDAPTALYDFNSLNQWLDYPLKRQRTDSSDLAMQSHEGPLGAAGFDPASSSADPYEFSDEASSGNVSYSAGAGSKRAFRGSKEEPRPMHNGLPEDDSAISFQDEPKPPGSGGGGGGGGGLLNEKDLVANYNLLDKMFDTSDDDSNSDNDPPNDTDNDSLRAHMGLNGGAGGLTGLGDKLVPGGLAADSEHAVLAHMFPTPPTNENQHTLSPGQGPDLTELSTSELTAIKQEPATVTVSDYSYVYKPAVTATFVSSSKYGPIALAGDSALPASRAADLTYTPTWHSFSLGQAGKAQLQHGHYTSVECSSQGASQLRSSASTGHMGGTERMTSLETSPAMAPQGGPRSAQQLTPRTPLSHELQSPQSNASSYMHNLKSVDNNPTNSTLPEVNSVVVNIMLSDSLLNLFKDENFESCTFCVCDMNIKGADVGLYLPDRSGELNSPCICGFSAVVNRRLGRHSGLFYEDEVDITGLRHDQLDVRKPSLAFMLNAPAAKKPDQQQGDKSDQGEVLPQDLLELLQGQFSGVYPSLTVAKYGGGGSASGRAELLAAIGPVHALARMDGCEACYSALEVGRQAMDNCTSTKLDDPHLKKSCMHVWPYLNVAKLPVNSQETLRKLRRLLPLLEDAIQKKRTTRVWESVYRITGPLSWKDFHLLAGRGSDETSEPQPIPTVLVGYDKEWMSLTPQALQYWDKLMLEPYGRQRDVAYLVVSPDTDFIIERVKTFFSELSQQYELCRLGRHRPIAKKIREGILRVNKKKAARLKEDGCGVDEWFSKLGEHPLAAKLRLYAQVCRHELAPFLTRPENIEKKDIFEELNKKPTPSSTSNTNMTNQHTPPPANMNQPRPSPAPSQSPSPKPPQTPSDEQEDAAREEEKLGARAKEEEEGDAPSIVIYLVDPFTYGQEYEAWDVPRLAVLGLLRCYQHMLHDLPEPLRQQVHLQVIPLASILEYRHTASSESLRSLALSVYTQCRRNVQHSVIGRTLTGFGPAASAGHKVNISEPGMASRARLYSPPFVLAPTRSDVLALTQRDTQRVLLCAYCLSEDQRWLLGVCTDNRGEVLETCTINIDIPNRNRRKKASARHIGLQKLWDFILGVMSGTVTAWRLVVGRFGRLGHGELKGWAGLLSRKNIVRASKQLRDMCHMCNFLCPDEIPCIHSACLVSMEMHGSIFVMHDTLKMEERQSSRITLTTPRDASVTHILVMPTSATASPSAGMGGGEQPQHDDTDANLDQGLIDMGIDIGDMDMADLGDFFPFDSIGMDSAGDFKPHGGTTSPDHHGAPSFLSSHSKEASMSISDAQEETGNLLQQPLAIGYYVSTAKTGPLPSWFYSACPHKHDLCPSCFKAALHVNCHSVQQDGSRTTPSHQLDSRATPDVLRYVLETYNSLSWLTLDAHTNERRSCLPVHFVVLMQLYHAINTFL